jgi:putative PIN family toxin of toxin-antitoxin system
LIRVVFDTNVVVSALLNPAGPPAQAFRLATSGSVQLCVTAGIYMEYEQVLHRPKFGLKGQTVAETLQSVRDRALWFRPVAPVRACADPDDDMFLECAIAAEAGYLTTGNLRHFPASFPGLLIVTPRLLLEIVAAENRTRN